MLIDSLFNWNNEEFAAIHQQNFLFFRESTHVHHVVIFIKFPHDLEQSCFVARGLVWPSKALSCKFVLAGWDETSDRHSIIITSLTNLVLIFFELIRLKTSTSVEKDAFLFNFFLQLRINVFSVHGSTPNNLWKCFCICSQSINLTGVSLFGALVELNEQKVVCEKKIKIKMRFCLPRV